MSSTETHPADAGLIAEIARIRDAVELIVAGTALPSEAGRAEASLRPLIALATGERRKALLADAVRKLEEAGAARRSLSLAHLGASSWPTALTFADLVFDAFDCLCWAVDQDEGQFRRIEAAA